MPSMIGIVLLLVGVVRASAPTATGETFNTTSALLEFLPAHQHHGFGGLSAGASSRLLWDYPEQQRAEILDFLFKPSFGAGLTINKVEIGGSVPSTDGAEPAIEPTGPGSLDCNRLSYEGWLMAESSKRNPNIKQYALSWGVPEWIGNGSYYSDENLQYHIDWMNCAKNAYSVGIDYIGVWNERSVGAVGLDWAVKLRRALDANGYEATKIIVPDGYLDPTLLQLLESNATMLAAVFGIGLHYPCDVQSQEVQDLGLAYWASEDYSSDAATWATGGDVWGRLLVQNYVEMNMTGTIAWATIWSVYPNLVCQHNGLTRAMEPWSGHYSVDSPIWASAHVGQFVQPGWWYLGTAQGGGSGWLAGGGAYITLVDSNTTATQFVTVLSTLSAGGRCILRPATSPQNITLTLASGFPRPALGGGSLWRTTESEQFALIAANITATEHADGTATIALPTLEADALYTFSSHPGTQTKGNTTPPASAAFPMPFVDDFETPGAAGTGNTLMPAYWADQYGLFELHDTAGPPTAFSGATNSVLEQMVLANPGGNGWATNRNPLTIAGDVTWSDYAVSVDAFLNTSAGAALESGVGAVELGACAPDPDSVAGKFQRFVNNTPASRYLENAGTRDCLNQNGCGGAGSAVITYTCVTGADTCSGPPPPGQPYNTLNLQWELTADGRLLNMVNGLCVTPAAPAAQARQRLASAPVTAQTAAPPSLEMQACASPVGASQQWSLNGTSGQLKHAATGLCMQQPLPQRYVEVCGRIGTLNGFAGWKDAYCLRSNQTDWWMVVASANGETILDNGPVPAGAWQPVQDGGWIRLGMVFAGDTIGSVVGGQTVAQTQDTSVLAGMVGVGSGFHGAAFDNLLVVG